MFKILYFQKVTYLVINGVSFFFKINKNRLGLNKDENLD